MILLDTSAIYALADPTDLNHDRALDLFGRALQGGETFLVHSYVLVEAAALLQRRLGLASAFRFLDQANDMEIRWIAGEDHLRAVELLRERGRRGLSLVDCTSFVVMRRYGVVSALAFDSDFEAEGFSLYA